MLYITRSRYKESVKAENIPDINKLIDAEIIPAIEKVEGVQSIKAYNSITGEVNMVMDIQNLATVDRIMSDPGVRAVAGKIYDVLVRTGGDVLYDRPKWQGLYGKS